MDYKQKYIKYKSKYINLRNNIGGEFNKELSEEERKFIKSKFKFIYHLTSLEAFHDIMEKMKLLPLVATTNETEAEIEYIKYISNRDYDLYRYLIFTSLAEKNKPIDLTWRSLTPSTNKEIGIMIDIDILFDTNMYYYYLPNGEYGTYFKGAVLSPNLNLILEQEATEDKEKYVKKLDIDFNLKNGFLQFVKSISESGINADELLKNTFQNSKYNDDLRELCFFKMIDLKKYCIGIFAKPEILDKIRDSVPKNISIFDETKLETFQKDL